MGRAHKRNMATVGVSFGDGSLRDREVAGNTGRKYSGAGCCRMKTVKAQQLVSS